jgi:hypothetical protein
VPGDERLSRGSAVEWLKNGGLDFEKAAIIKETTEKTDNSGA